MDYQRPISHTCSLFHAVLHVLQSSVMSIFDEKKYSMKELRRSERHSEKSVSKGIYLKMFF